jgi:hypothetical protein
MHGHGIAGALLGKLRQIGLGLMMLVGTSLAVGTARADVTYDYTGGAFTANTCAPMPCTSPLTNVSGDFVFSQTLTGGLGPLVSFSISDGPDTITSSTLAPNPIVGTPTPVVPFIQGYNTDPSGSITSALFGVTDNIATIGISPSGDAATDSMGGQLNRAGNATPGTWTLAGMAMPPPTGPLPSKPQSQVLQAQANSTQLNNTAIGLSLLATVCPACGAGEGYLLALSAYEAQDPIDSNYTTVAQPIIPTMPSVPPLPPSVAAAIPVFSNMFFEAAYGVALDNAIQTAIDRADGAFVANVPNYVSLQLNAEQGFFNQEQQVISEIGQDLISLSSLLEPLFDPFISASEVAAYQAQLSTEGFPSDELSIMEGLGLSQSDIAMLVEELDSIDPASLAGNYPTELAVLGGELTSGAAVPEPSSLFLICTSILIGGALRISKSRIGLLRL